MPGGRHAYIPAVKVWRLPRSISSPSRIQTSSQKSWVIVSVVSTPASNWRRRVTSPSPLWLRIFCLTPDPPAPPVAEPATGSQAIRSGLKNSSSGLGMHGLLKFLDEVRPQVDAAALVGGKVGTVDHGGHVAREAAARERFAVEGDAVHEVLDLLRIAGRPFFVGLRRG